MSAFDELKQGRLLKVISGAAVNDAVDVYRYSVIWTLAGASMIDVCADHHVVKAAVKGRNDAIARFGLTAGETLIMASPTLPGDVHRLKAELIADRCTNCEVCLPPVCPDDCILSGPKVIVIETPKCRGCNSCVEICPEQALKLVPMPTPPLPSAVEVAQQAGCDSVELHLSGESPTAVRRYLEAVWPVLEDRTIVSVCVGSQQSSPTDVVQILRQIDEVRRGRPMIIQADGSTMGGRPGALQALALAELVLEVGLPNLWVIASGSVTELTWETASRHGLKIGGVGIGIRARELVREALHDPAVFADDEAMRKIAEHARVLMRPADLEAVVDTGRSFRGPALAKVGAIERKQRRSDRKKTEATGPQ
jgi:Pyruvate/2-oxoacid:ferredoxin oxidoreductase delta subunit